MVGICRADRDSQEDNLKRPGGLVIRMSMGAGSLYKRVEHVSFSHFECAENRHVGELEHN
jgi:hypothetical protein